MESKFEHKIWKFYKQTFWAMEGLFQQILSEEELTFSQITILFAIDEKERISVGELSDNAKINKGNCSSTCKKLESCGYLIRERNKLDERRVELELTPKGKSILNEINDSLHQHYEKVLEKLTDAEITNLEESLKELSKFFELLIEEQKKEKEMTV